MLTGPDEVEYFHHLDYLVHQPETSVEEVLNDDYFSDELAAKNSALLEFLARPDHVLELVELVRRGPSPQAPMESQFRLASLATDTLASEGCWNLQDALLQNEAALDSLYSILRESDRLLPLTASFLHRILTYFSNWFDSELLTFLRGKADFVDCVVARLDLAAVPEILFKLLLAGTYHNYISVAEWLDANHLVEKLLDKYLDGPEEMQPHACKFFSGLLYDCRQWQLMRPLGEEDSKPSAILQRLESDETVNRLIKALIECESRASSKTLIPLLLASLRHLLLPSSRSEPGVQLPGLPDFKLDYSALSAAAESIARIRPCLPVLKRLLLAEVAESASPLLTGPQLGAVRIHVIRFICYLLKDAYPVIVEEFACLDIIGVILDLFFAYKWHSLLHASVEFLLKLVLHRVIFVTSFQEEGTKDEVLSNGAIGSPTVKDCAASKLDHIPDSNGVDESHDLVNGDTKSDHTTMSSFIDQSFLTILNQILVDHNLLKRMLTVWSENENSKGKPGLRRAGYMGHLRAMANSLVAFLLPSSKSHENGDEISQPDVLRDSMTTPPTTPVPCWLEPLRKKLRDSLINSLPQDLWIHWCDFVSGDLARANTTCYINYANFPNSNSSSSTSSSPDSEDVNTSLQRFSNSDDAIASAMQQAYHQYVSQSLSLSFPDFFGFPENEFDDSRERLDSVVEHALFGLNFSLDIQEDTVNNVLFEQACNELVAADGEEIGDELVGSQAEGSASATSLDRAATPIPLSVAASFDEPTIVSMDGTETRTKLFSLSYLRDVFDEVQLQDEKFFESGDELTSFKHAREPSRRGDELMPDFSQANILPSSIRLPHILSPLRAQVTPPDVGAAAGVTSPVKNGDLQPKLAVAPGPTISNGIPLMSSGRSRQFPASVPPSSQASSTSANGLINVSKSAPFEQLYNPLARENQGNEVRINNSLEMENTSLLPRLPTVSSELVFPAPPTFEPPVEDSELLDAHKPVPKQSPLFSSMFVRYEPLVRPTPKLSLSSSLPRPILPTMRAHRLTRAPLYDENGDSPPVEPGLATTTNGGVATFSSPACDDDFIDEDTELEFQRRRRRRPGNMSADDTHSLDNDSPSALLKGAWFFKRVQQEQDKDREHQLHRAASDGFIPDSLTTSGGKVLSSKKELQPFVISEADLDEDDFVLREPFARTSRFRTHTTLNLKSSLIDSEAL